MKKLLFIILLGIALPFNMHANNIPRFSTRHIPIILVVMTGEAIKKTFNKVKKIFKSSSPSRQNDDSCC